MQVSKKSVPLHCVFHGIRFKVNKGWAQRSPFFMPVRFLFPATSSLWGQNCLYFGTPFLIPWHPIPYTLGVRFLYLVSRAFCKSGLGGCSMQGNGRISTVDGNGWNACLLREILVSVSFLLGQTLRACLNFAQLYFECCFRGYLLFPRIFFRCTEERSGLRDEVCREKRPERGSKEAEYKSKRGKLKQALSRVREKIVLALSSV